MISVVNRRAIDRLPISIGDQVEVIQQPEDIRSPVP